MDKISPTGDLAFKKVLASEENKDILAGLITDFFGVEVQDITIENPYDIALYREALQGDASPVLRQTFRACSESRFRQIFERDFRQARKRERRIIKKLCK